MLNTNVHIPSCHFYTCQPLVNQTLRCLINPPLVNVWSLQVEQHNQEVQQSFQERIAEAFGSMQRCVQLQGSKQHDMLSSYTQAVGERRASLTRIVGRLNGAGFVLMCQMSLSLSFRRSAAEERGGADGSSEQGGGVRGRRRASGGRRRGPLSGEGAAADDAESAEQGHTAAAAGGDTH